MTSPSLAFFHRSSLIATIFFTFTFMVHASSRYIDNLDGTITDANTGLEWMRCAVGQTWTGAACSGNPVTYTYNQAITVKSTLAGHNDWRLPTIRELLTITDMTRHSPAIDAATFPNTPLDWFWSVSPVAGYSSLAWSVYFDSGDDTWGNRQSSRVLRLVRAGLMNASLLNNARSNTDYFDNQDGTVKHIPTCLEWKRCPEEQSWNGTTCTGTLTNYKWDTASALTRNFAGHNDWHLPTLDELRSLVDYTIPYPGPTINQLFFPVTPATNFWSKSPMSDNSASAWSIDFINGDDNWGDKSHESAVRLMRTGSCPWNLLIEKMGTGNGTVTSNPVGINCGSDCAETYNHSTTVTLTATPASGSLFTGWSGDPVGCTETAPCVVTMNAAKTVKTTFDLIKYSLIITKSGNGTVTSSPAGINCGTDCSENYLPGTSVTLTATPTGAAVFTKWTGACSGTSTSCVVTMNTAKTAAAVFTTPLMVPVISAVAGNARVTLKWSAITGATSYKIFQGTTAGGESATPVKTGVTGTSVAITNLIRGTKYFFKMAAVNAGGTGPLSNEVSVIPPLPPTAPRINSAVPDDAKVTLKWSAVTGATSYNIHQGTTTGGESATPVKTGVTGTNVTITGLSNRERYFFHIKAVNVGGISPPSNEVAATPSPRSSKPDFIITKLSISSIPAANKDFELTVTVKNQGMVGGRAGYLDIWANDDGITTKSCNADGDAWVDVVGSLAAGASRNVTLISPAGVGGLKTLRVFIDSFCETFETNELNNQFTKSYTVAPEAPIFSVVQAGNLQIRLKWSAVIGATGYKIYQGTTTEGEDITTPVIETNDTSATITKNITNGIKYFFKMTAVNGDAASPFSDEISVTPMEQPPAVPVINNPPVIADKQVTLEWSAVAGATSYKIYQGAATGQEDTTKPITATGTSATITNLINDTQYFFKMTAVNEGGASALSNEVNATPTAPTKVPDAPTITVVVGNGQVTLNWSAVTGATSYKIYQGTVKGQEDTTNPVKTVTETNATITGLINDTEYFFKITAVNTMGESSLSNEVRITPTEPVTTLRINDTGITTCSTNAENGFPCPVTDYPGQDGDFGRDANFGSNNVNGRLGFNFTKLDENGNSLPATATSWSCVKDNVTGLIWEVKTDDGGLRDKDNTYSWYNPDPNTNAGHPGRQNLGTGFCQQDNSCDTYAFILKVNTQTLCGHNDWRMPSPDELISIVDMGATTAPLIDTNFFPNTPAESFWSSSVYPRALDVFGNYGAWAVQFDAGGPLVLYADTWPDLAGIPVRLVRRDQ
ncbi:hypothetical protein CCP3SC5AM1_540008 [Gammaproteobacteria bacterium]